MAEITRHGLYGGPRQRYGPFSGKATENVQLTRLGLYGGARPLYGSFDGKTSSATGADPPGHEGIRRNVGRMIR
jgi:hypothetical protein